MTVADANTRSEAAALLVRSLDAMATGSRGEFDRIYDPAAVNREAATEPPVTRAGLMALQVTMSGRHTGDFVTYRPDTDVVDAVMPPTGKAFAATQTHWFRTRDGMITEHWANRDDLAMARQAGWVPPTPAFLLRAAIAKRRASKRSS